MSKFGRVTTSEMAFAMCVLIALSQSSGIQLLFVSGAVFVLDTLLFVVLIVMAEAVEGRRTFARNITKTLSVLLSFIAASGLLTLIAGTVWVFYKILELL